MSRNHDVFLVTGSQGLLGSRLVPLLLSEVESCRVITVDKVERMSAWNDDSRVQTICGDLRDEALWSGLSSDITHVFHLAAVIPWKNKDKNKASIAQDNVIPLMHLIEQSQDWNNLKQVIFSSSVSVYAKTGQLLDESSRKEPSDIYGASKLAGESMLNCLVPRGISVTSLRYSSIYGAGQYSRTVLPMMVEAAQCGGEIVVYGDGSRTQDFLYCDDAARANLLACRYGASGAFNIGAGKPTAMAELARDVSDVFTNGDARIRFDTDKADDDQGCMIDMARAKKRLKYQPMIELRVGLLRMKSGEREGTCGA